MKENCDAGSTRHEMHGPCSAHGYDTYVYGKNCTTQNLSTRGIRTKLFGFTR